MNSYDKMLKYVVEKFQAGVSPLQQIARNQETLISQNSQIIHLLHAISSGRQLVPEPATSDVTDSSAETAAVDEPAAGEETAAVKF
ncbi:Hypothetical protein LUCI_1986 [Lucifera butyrica]|uniref:Uncharacterized protein n=1 Tax=Lucifera butyrica TaxID=1351585 RepID=A0A498R752_9FIRM|nr:hypothetical protein [Lucifera butyrica]VBB06750.1 Hypothetical protein LUCI_1986 [Lucifera butyrica]